jgi:UDP-N-acetylglucosamine diphosphorylase / glucose-1-phosphate thymidylyltransferase / UDP-N-acetylgalactosamine diphosphorylase / glucosamine-1-phosphate N-acetyltransferase / galactosamine-1-phosphate N-acetyltransferase
MKKIKVGVIPAAGHGRRLNSLPLTRVLPKCLLPILNKPILEYVIENMQRMGVEDVYMIVGFKKEIIQEYFGNGEDFSLHITYIEQNPLRGIAHAISLAKNFVSEPFSVILGDDLTITSSLSNLVETFWEKNAWVVEGAVPENNVEAIKRACCIALGNAGKIKEIIEKPLIPKSNLRGVGVYLFDPKVFDFIEITPASSKRNEKEITDTIGLIAKKGRAYAALINGMNINVNTSSDLMVATKLLLKFEYPVIKTQDNGIL